jgi:hypothetical protein
MEILDELEPRFRATVEELIIVCDEAGFRVVPYQGYRSPEQQARLWRQSRTRTQIDARLRQLRAAGKSHVADIIEVVGPQHGQHVTNALPFESSHQFRRAVDCYIEGPESGRALWRDRRLDGAEFGRAGQLYERFGRAAEALQLTWGGRWSIGDFGHVQAKGPGAFA